METIPMHAIYSDACKNVRADTTSLLLSKPKKREFCRQTLEKRKYVCFPYSKECCVYGIINVSVQQRDIRTYNREISIRF